jgi:hypothetical protein
VKDLVSAVYRSPAGRVVAYSYAGEVVERHEPGPDADAAWARFSKMKVYVHENATWLDLEPRERPVEEPEKTTEEVQLRLFG